VDFTACHLPGPERPGADDRSLSRDFSQRPTPDPPMTIPRLKTLPLLALLALAGSDRIGASPSRVVEAGKPADARFVGKPWDFTPDGLAAEGTGRFLYARHGLGAGDFRITARLALARADGSAASFVMDDSNFGFDGRNGGLFAEGPLFDGTKTPTKTGVKAGVPFDFEVVRKDGLTRILISGIEVLRKEQWNGAIGRIGLRPWRNRMTVTSFELEGSLVAPPQPPAPLFLSGFAGGRDGYHTYRIPALAVTNNGTVLAFCEGRKNSWGDSGDIDLLVKRSTDNGRTWSKQQVIWDDGPNCCGNPCAVVDRETGTIFLLSTWNRGDDHESAIIARTSKDTRRVFVLQSDDDGLTWSKPREITATTKKTDWTWYATGPGGGIQIEHGPNKGRLVIPCDHIEAETKHYYSHAIHSDDHGKTWQLGGRTPQHQVNECEVVELTGGRLMLNMRNYNRAKRSRQTAVSDDGGLTWRDQKHDAALIEPICQAAIQRFRWPQGDKPGVVLFSNPASTNGRVNLTVRASMDDAKTWPFSKVLWRGPSGYSDLAVLANGKIGCFYEGGADNIAESIIFAAFDLDSLTQAPAHQQEAAD
jgi:sialidase-1